MKDYMKQFDDNYQEIGFGYEDRNGNFVGEMRYVYVGRRWRCGNCLDYDEKKRWCNRKETQRYASDESCAFIHCIETFGEPE